MNKQISLKNLFLIWLVIIAIFTVIASFLVTYNQSYLETKLQAKTMIKKQASRLALITEHVMLKDKSLLREIIADIASEHHVKSIFVLDPDKTIIFSDSYDLVGKTISETVLGQRDIFEINTAYIKLLEEQDNNFIAAVPFTWPVLGGKIRSDRLGWVIITSDIAVILNNKIKKDLWDRAVIPLVILLIMAFTWRIVYLQISQPITAIALAAYRVSNGNYSTELPKMKFWELNLIRDGFAKMIKEIEQKITSLSDSENRFRLLLKNAPVGIVAFDKTMRLKHVNDVFIDMLAISKEQVSEGASLEQFSELIQALSTNKISKNNKVFGPNSNQKTRNDDEQAMTVVIQLKDAHQTIKIFAVDTNDEDIPKVFYFQDVTNELALDKIKSQFIATAAHELRTPMTMIKGYVELLMQKGNELQSASKEKMLQAIRTESEDMVLLLDDLLDISKIDAGVSTKLDLKLTMPTSFIGDICQRFHVSDDPRQVEFHASANLPFILCDQQKIKQVIKACLSNAFKFSSQDSPVSVLLTSAIVHDQGAIKIVISDQGIGMTDSECKHAFERFYRADVSGHIAGTGLGLSLVKEIIELHGGEVEISSKKGQGTNIVLYLYLEPDS